MAEQEKTGTAEAAVKPVWDENNQLVDEELHQHYREQAEIVLGKRSPLDGSELEEEAPPIVTGANPHKPFVSQQHESQTRDPMTSPIADADPNNVPTKLTPMTEEAQAIDEAIEKGAEAITTEEVADEPALPSEPPKLPEPKKLPDPGSEAGSEEFARPNSTVDKLTRDKE